MELCTQIIQTKLKSEEYCNIPLSVGFFRILDMTRDGDRFVGYLQSRLGNPVGLAPHVIDQKGVYDPVQVNLTAPPLKLLFGRSVGLVGLAQRVSGSLDVTPKNLKTSVRKAVLGAYCAGLLPLAHLYMCLVAVPKLWFMTEQHHCDFLGRVPKVDPLEHGHALVTLAQVAVASACMKGWRND